jgi:hypothetical protein
VVVTTMPDPIPFLDDATVLLCPDPTINISKWWTLGLDWIADYYTQGEQWDVLIAESDARMTTADVETVRGAMRHHGTVMAGADRYGLLEPGQHHRRTDNRSWLPPTIDRAPSGADSRIPGVMCVIAGETGIRHDPEFRWWLADDDFEWQHRANGGTLLVGGTTVWHEGTQGPLTGERLQAWQEDEPKFRAKWGGVPADGGILS